MAWTSPRTWVAGEVVTAALLNAHLRDNLLALFDKPSGSAVTASAGVTSSSTFSYLRSTVAIVTVDITTTASTVADAGLFTLPVGHRPAATINGTIALAGSPEAIIRVYVTAGGIVASSIALASGVTLRGQIVVPVS